MGLSIDKLIVFCENLENFHVTRCKRYDDASGYTRSRNEEIRTNDAKRDEMNSKFYHELKKILSKYQKIEEIIKFGNANELGFEYVGEKITEVMEDDCINI